MLSWILSALIAGATPLHSSDYLKISPAAAQKDPSALARLTNRFWKAAALRLLSDSQREFASARRGIEARLPAPIQPEKLSAESLLLEGTYGHLPEVYETYTEASQRANYPLAPAPPSRHSWFQVAANAALALRSARIAAEAVRSPPQDPQAVAKVSDLFSAAQRALAKAALSARYIQTWEPLLERQWDAIDRLPINDRGRRLPTAYRLAHATAVLNKDHWAGLREELRPKRIFRHRFLPSNPRGKITLPIATDIRSPRFLREVEAALAVYWQRSPWARVHGSQLSIQWLEHAPWSGGPFSLEKHIASFSPDAAGLTTGAPTTQVRGHVMVVGPGKIEARTLAHELGHLLGFDDCYHRTWSSQGFYGTAILEWDNPIYPDELMCDDTWGVARAGKWE